LVIGDPNIGKTALINRYRENKFVEENSDAINDEQDIVEIPGCSVSVQTQEFSVVFLDGSRYCKSDLKIERSNNPFKNVDGVFLCYDISSRESFENLDKKWKVQMAKYKSLDSLCIIVLGLKGELPHAIDTSLIKMTKPYIEEEFVVSSKTGENMENTLNTLITCIMNSTQAGESINSNTTTSNTSAPHTYVSLSSIPPAALSNQIRNVGDKPHQFKLKYFPKPTWCMFCDLFIWGVTSPQGYECTKCGYQTHKKCVKFIPHMCGLK